MENKHVYNAAFLPQRLQNNILRPIMYIMLNFCYTNYAR
nr:MAG TPA: hypothetical protein [Microviridae sp.]